MSFTVIVKQETPGDALAPRLPTGFQPFNAIVQSFNATNQTVHATGQTFDGLFLPGFRAKMCINALFSQIQIAVFGFSAIYYIIIAGG